MSLTTKVVLLAILGLIGISSYFFINEDLLLSFLSPKPSPVKTLSKDQKPDYLIILLGDSMTEYLGNSDELRAYMSEYYPGKTFDFYNYGFGSTNILSAPQRLTSWTKHGRDFQPIIDVDFDLILVESFGHNPLSEFNLDQGLIKQEETLTQIIRIITEKQPKEKIVFVATLAPNSKLYGKGAVDLDDKKRAEWVAERNAYIKNHIKYAQNNDIPIINIYQASLDLFGDGRKEYVTETDHIHPSPKGIYLISKQIAEFIYKNNLLK